MILTLAISNGQKLVNKQPIPLSADTADFRDQGDRIALAKRGIFSIDRTAKRDQRRAQAEHEAAVRDAFIALGLDQKREYRTIAHYVQANGLVPDGCWVTSSGAYATRRGRLDDVVLDTARRYNLVAKGDTK